MCVRYEINSPKGFRECGRTGGNADAITPVLTFAYSAQYGGAYHVKSFLLLVEYLFLTINMLHEEWNIFSSSIYQYNILLYYFFQFKYMFSSLYDVQ